MCRAQGFSLGIATKEMLESNYMQYDCASHLCFQYQQFNHMARKKIITLTRPHIPFSAGINIILLHMTLSSKPLSMLFLFCELRQRHSPFNHLGFQTPEPWWTARDGAGNTGWGSNYRANRKKRTKDEPSITTRKPTTKLSLDLIIIQGEARCRRRNGRLHRASIHYARGRQT